MTDAEAEQDEKLVKIMAKQPNRKNFIIIPERDSSTPLYARDELIRKSLANQLCVIVKGQLEGPEKFSKEEIGAEMGPLSRICQYNGR